MTFCAFGKCNFPVDSTDSQHTCDRCFKPVVLAACKQVTWLWMHVCMQMLLLVLTTVLHALPCVFHVPRSLT